MEIFDLDFNFENIKKTPDENNEKEIINNDKFIYKSRIMSSELVSKHNCKIFRKEDCLKMNKNRYFYYYTSDKQLTEYVIRKYYLEKEESK